MQNEAMTGPTALSALADAEAALGDAERACGTVRAALVATRKLLGPPLPVGWSTVTFFDDFAGPLDTSVWSVLDQQGLKRDQAWLSASQVSVQNSALTITAANLPSPVNGRTVTSGALSTQGPKGFKQHGGRFEICAALPTAPALWSAGWLRNAPAVGELDIFEASGLASPIVQTAHQDTSGLLDHLGYDWQPPAGWSRADDHVYALEWDADTGTVRWYVDAQLTRTVTAATVGYPSGKPASWLTSPAYAQPMAFLLNLQVGGRFSAYYGRQVVNPAQLDGTAQAQLCVRWVRALTR